MKSNERPRRAGASGGFVWLYALAWPPYLVVYGAVLAASLGVSAAQAAMGAVANGLPPAVLGWAVIRGSRAMSWRATSLHAPGRARIVVFHASFALAYALASAAGTWFLFRIFHRFMTGSWHWSLGQKGPLVWQLLVATLLYVVLAGLGRTWALGERLREEEARTARARELAARSQLAALRARLDPHFLFNTLHSLLALVRSDAKAAEEALERFGDLLRYVLRTRGPDCEEVTLAEELAFLADYLRLEALRLGDRLDLAETIAPAALSVRIPAFTLQPLVENALRHAVEPRAQGARVTIRGHLEDGRLVIEVGDDGPGATPEDVEDGGMGLELVRDRLLALHGAAAGLEVDTTPGAGFRVRAWLPVARGQREDAL